MPSMDRFFASSSSSRSAKKTTQAKKKKKRTRAQTTSNAKTQTKTPAFATLAPEQEMDMTCKLDRTEVVCSSSSSSAAQTKVNAAAQTREKKKKPQHMTVDWVLNGGDNQEEPVATEPQPLSGKIITIADDLAQANAPKPEFNGYLFSAPRFVHIPPVFNFAKAAELDRLEKDALKQQELRKLKHAASKTGVGADVEKLVRAASAEPSAHLPDVFMSSTFNIDVDVANRCKDLRKPLWLQPDDESSNKPRQKRFQRKPRKYAIFDEKLFSGTRKRYLRMPRPYGLECFPDVHPDWHKKLMTCVDQNRTHMATFAGTLLPYQEHAVRHVLHMLKTLRCHSGLLEASCGSGKTVMALYIMSVLKVPTVIVVHTEVLFDQWQDRIKQFLPHAKIGTLRAKKRPAKDCDICVAMLQTTAKIDESETHALERFGLLVIDECHHICAKMFSQCLRKFMAPYQLGLSATVQRGDGLAHTIEWLIGPRLYNIERVNNEVDILPVAFKDRTFKHEELSDGSMDYTATLTQLCADPWRTRRIAEVLYGLATKEKRQIVAISARTQLLQDLHELLPGSGLIIGKGKFTKKQLLAMVPPELALAVSKVKLKRDIEKLLYDNAKTKRIILASQNLLAEGADIPRLDTLVLLTPIKVKENFNQPHKKNTKLLVQAIGRVQRGYSKRRPLVVDFYDSYKMFLGSFRARQKWYAGRLYAFRNARTLCKPFVRPQTELGRELTKKTGEKKKQTTLSFLLETSPHFKPHKSAPNCVDSNSALARLTHEVLGVPFPSLEDVRTLEQASHDTTPPPTQMEVLESDAVDDALIEMEEVMRKEEEAYDVRERAESAADRERDALATFGAVLN